MSANEHVDVDTLGMLKEVMGEDFAHLLQTYMKDCQVRLDTLRDALSQGDSETVRKEAHSIKGSSSNIGAGPMADLSLEMENKGRDGDLTDSEALVDRMDEELQALVTILQGMLAS